jgi:hypothetical protein
VKLARETVSVAVVVRLAMRAAMAARELKLRIADDVRGKGSRLVCGPQGPPNVKVLLKSLKKLVLPSEEVGWTGLV